MSTSLVTTDDQWNALYNEFELLHLVAHRNANQHRRATWWKNFNVLHRKLRQLLLLRLDQQLFENEGKTCHLVWTKLGGPRYVKRTVFRSPQFTLKRLARYILVKLLPICMRMSYTVIEMGQFIALGFTLEGMVSRIWSVMKELGMDEPIATENVQVAEVKSTADAVQPVESVEISEPLEPVEPAEPTIEHITTPIKPAKKHRKHRTARKTMDDIFG